ncbi:hypothetical protein [Sphingobacterium kitahiroshimense]|uniref:hypothetical protein n=1 Tax=Sphingobacterium kitahiroshimense TaxID=470446 RepID=UPI0028EAAD4F|nr:hypothetical protein [uncultured Sphingobacterium sp.]
MKKTMLFLSFFVGMFTTRQGVAQELKDYVITMKGDTIYGELGSVKSKKVYMLVNGERKTYYPPQLYRIYNHNTGKHYATSFIQMGMQKIKDSDPKMFIIKEKVKLKNKPLFTEILHDGDIIVYNFKDYNSGGGGMMPVFSSSNDCYYALKRSTGEIAELKISGLFILGRMSKKNRNANLVKMIADEPELVAKLENEEKLNYDVFSNYIKEYNAIKKTKDVYPIAIF